MVYDDIEYTVDTVTDNALNLLAWINKYLLDHEVRDTSGAILQFVVNITSPIWLIILGMGYMLTTFQKLLYACGLSFNISSCSVPQLQNLMEIAGTSYLPGTPTTVTCNILATADGSCVITTEDIITYVYEGENVIFAPIYETTIAAGTTAFVTLQANRPGAIFIPGGAITAFDEPPVNFASMISLNSLPGRLEETAPEARTRLQKGIEGSSGLDAAISALRALPGIQTANLFFNTNLITDLVIAGMTIPPRCCGMIVQGYSDSIAKTYYDYLNVPCVGGSLTQDYMTLASQHLPITYDLPEQIEMYIRVKVRIPVTYLVPTEYQQAIKNLLLPASGSLLIGQDYSQRYLLSLTESFDVPDIEIVGLEVSTDNITFSDTTDLELNQICSISAENITFIEVT